MESSARCPSSDQLNRLLHDRLSAGEQAEVSRHLESCEACQSALETLAADSGIWRDVPQRLAGEQAGIDEALQGVMDAHQSGFSDGETHTEASLGHEVQLDFLEPSDDPDHLGTLGGYEITDVIGHGGMGVVLKGHDAQLNRFVAIKVLMPELASNANARKRFGREGRAAAAVNHVNVATIHAVDEIKGMPLLVMEFIAGKSLEQRLAESEPLQVEDIVRIGMQTAGGLAAAHAQGLVHRDIKPANILLENSVERVKISDFGLARAVDDVRITRPGVVTGTPEYMSPEQARGETVDHRADLFSLGGVLYAMCAGRSPFRADSTPAVIHRVCSETPRPIREVNPDVPEWLIAVIDKLLAKDPGERFQSAAEVSRLLEQYLAHLQQPSAVPEPPRPITVKPRSGRTRRALELLRMPAVVAVLLIVGISLTDAAGLTEVTSTVIRIVRGDGTLVVRVDDPDISVSIDGDELVITGAGVQEIRVTPGDHEIQYLKNGEPIHQQLVSIERGGRQVVEVNLEPAERAVMEVEEEAQHERVWAYDGLTEVMSVSPDGRYIVFRDDETDDVAIHDLQTGENRPLTDNGPDGKEYTTEAVFSPDGEWVAYNWSNYDYECALHVVRADGSESRQVFRDEAGQWVQPAGWTPDGRQILCRLMGEETAQIVFVSVADGSHRVVKTLNKTTSSHPILALSPDGQYIAYEVPAGEERSDPSDVYVLSADGSREFYVSIGPGDENILGWAPDGERLLVRSTRNNLDAAWLFRLVDGKPTGYPELVREGLASDLGPGQFTADGAFYYVQDPLRTPDELWVLRNFLPVFVPLEATPQPEQHSVWSDPQLADLFSISPDETVVAFRDNDTGDLAVANLEDGTVRRLSNNAVAWEAYPDNARVSPDGRHIACEWRFENGLKTDLRVYTIDGGEPRVLYTPDGEDVLRARPQDWSPDGKQLLVRLTNGDYRSDSTQIALVSLEDGTVQVLKRIDYRSVENYGSNLRFSPDGRFIAYEFMPSEDSGNTDIALMSLDGRHDTVLVAHDADDDILDWTPDGRGLLFSSYRGGNNERGAWLIEIEDGVPRGEPRLVIAQVGEYGEFAADGTFFDVRDGEVVQDVHVATLDPDSGALLEGPVTASERFPGVTSCGAWSPDGKFLAYYANVADRPDSLDLSHKQIVIRSTVTAEESVLELPGVFRGRGGIGGRMLYWSPDGRSLLLSGFTQNNAVRPNPRGIFRLDVQTGEVTNVVTATDGKTILGPHGWSADGAEVVYRRVVRTPATWTRQHLRRNLQSGTTTELHQERVTRTSARALAMEGAISPDGGELALFTQQFGEVSVLTMPMAGGEPRLLHDADQQFYPTTVGRCLAWAPDGRSLLFSKGRWDLARGSNPVLRLWRIPADGSEPEPLEFAASGLLNLDIHPDGRRIAYTRLQRVHELRATEGLLTSEEEP